MSLSFDIGSSDCKTIRLVSLTRDCYSVFIDLSGGRDLLELTANGYYMHFAFFVKGCQTTFLANFQFHFYTYRSLLTSMFAVFFVELAADGYYMHNDFPVKGFLETQP
jgi:hypothetical protein